MSVPKKAPRSSLKPLIFVFAAALGLAALSYIPKSQAPGAPEGTPDAGRPRAARAGANPEDVKDLVRPDDRGDATDAVARNVFRFQDSPTPTPTLSPLPTATPILPGSPLFVGPLPIQPTATPTPIIPPPLPFKALGVFGSRDDLIVSLEASGRIINAREGDVIDGRFIVRKINRESVDFAFKDIPPDITKRLPIPLP
jgi:hypothetical protein